MNFIGNAIAWHFWPKMVGFEGAASAIRFTMSLDGERWRVPDPVTTPPLSGFVEALQEVRRAELSGIPTNGTVKVECLRIERPRDELGWIATQTLPSFGRTQVDDEDPEKRTGAVFTGRSCHVALMRQAELVVRYLRGPEIPNPALEWVGVFKPTSKLDALFAAAEPPTHDDWSPSLVADKAHRRYVNVALKRINELVRDQYGVKGQVVDTPAMTSGAVVADHLGVLMGGLPGGGASPPKPPKEGKARAQKPHPQIRIRDERLELMGAHTTTIVEFDVVAGRDTEVTRIEAHVAAATGDGRSETDVPEGAPVPVVTGFFMAGQPHYGSSIDVPATYTDTLLLQIRQPEGVAAVVDLRAVNEEAR